MLREPIRSFDYLLPPVKAPSATLFECIDGAECGESACKINP